MQMCQRDVAASCIPMFSKYLTYKVALLFQLQPDQAVHHSHKGFLKCIRQQLGPASLPFWIWPASRVKGH